MTFATSRVRAFRGELAGALWLGAGIVAAIAVLAVHVLVLPPALVMPVLGVGLMTSGLALAAIVWKKPRRAGSSGITAWDVSGALYFLGCGAAMLTEPEQILPFLEEIRIRR